MYVANKHTRVVHYPESQTERCRLHGMADEDQLSVDDDDTLRLMIEVEHFTACPECMQHTSFY